MEMKRRNRSLIIIGGHEDKQQKKEILKEIAHRVGSGKLIISTVASEAPQGYFEEYERLFRNLGVRHIYKLEVNNRVEATLEKNLRTLDDATALFFTGGDQLKITSQIGDTPIFQRMHQIYNDGGLIAGTSAGASVMCETMLVSGNGDESNKIAELRMAPGLGLIAGVIIDQHFAERGRMGRLLGAVAQNPANLGIGIDENTAILVEQEKDFYVLGEGAVYVLDGSGVTDSNLTEQFEGRTLSIYDIRLHVLSQGDAFNLENRRPEKISKNQKQRLFGNAAMYAQADSSSG
jgi:cyanophycinase